MKKLLIIDDEEDVLAVISLRLNRQGFHVVCAGTGEEGLEILKTYVPDLILLDIRLPGINGFEVCRKIRQNPEMSSTAILFFTAGQQEAHRLEYYQELGAQGYIMKPFEAPELLNRVAECLNGIPA